MYQYSAILVRVVDGDTFDADVDLGFHVFVRLRFRLLDVDTPERGQPGFSEATSKLRNLLVDEAKPGEHGGSFVVESKKTGKYGRWLAKIPTNDGGTVNAKLGQWLKDMGWQKAK